MPNVFPAILVHGLFGWGPSEAGGFPYWGTALQVPSALPRSLASVGPISSSHDRACELAFQIKGGTVDYGEAHATRAGHAQRGRVFAVGSHPGWSAAKPVHLVGHSMGAPTVWMLQHLLAQDYFGWGSNANWVKSISCISGVLNGSTATYFFGCDEKTGLIRKESVADFLTDAIELLTAVTGEVFDRFYDFDLGHWGLHRTPDESLGHYLARISKSPLFRDKDNGAYGLTIQGLREQNSDCVTNPTTFYFSYATEQTFRGPLTGYHRPEPMMNPFLVGPSLYMGSKIFKRDFYKGFRSSDWWPNDGLVSTYSQVFPRSGRRHASEQGISDRPRFEPGKWYYETLEGVDHIDIVTLPQLSQIGFQKRFYARLFERLAAL